MAFDGSLPPSIAGVESWLLPALSRWFRLEAHGATDRIPAWDREPSIFVMNHTAVLGLEVYLLYALLRELRPEARRPATTVWPPFLTMPGLGAFYRAGGCIPMSVEGASAELRAGRSVLILPEGPDATDVRDEVGPFHAGFLRVARELAGERVVPIVPFGWAGVDEANPWWVSTHPTVVRLLMKPMMPKFDFALIPRPPLLRPSKVVFVAGEPLRFTAEELGGEPAIRAAVARTRATVIALVEEAKRLREESIEKSAAEQWIHRLTGSRRVLFERRS
jgi:1-acyl-sn-glycerol-3-phosphate acyltransferase